MTVHVTHMHTLTHTCTLKDRQRDDTGNDSKDSPGSMYLRSVSQTREEQESEWQ